MLQLLPVGEAGVWARHRFAPSNKHNKTTKGKDLVNLIGAIGKTMLHALWALKHTQY
jgi:hypothetical protein